MRILIVEDSAKMARLLKKGLDRQGYAVDVVGSGQDALWMATENDYDAIVLDVILDAGTEPIDGFEVCRRLRRARRWAPVLMVTARDAVEDRVYGLDVGADDYLTKPFSPRELLARIRALLRRSRARETVADGLSRIRAYRFAGWELNVRLRRLKSPQGETIATTNSEFNLLVAFLAAPQRVLSREQLLERSRLHDDEVYDRSVDVQVGRLRRKIEPKGTRTQLIRTERGAGYVFTATVETVR
jgi:two-component system, OmpR family, response regulator